MRRNLYAYLGVAMAVSGDSIPSQLHGAGVSFDFRWDMVDLSDEEESSHDPAIKHRFQDLLMEQDRQSLSKMGWPVAFQNSRQRAIWWRKKFQKVLDKQIEI